MPSRWGKPGRRLGRSRNANIKMLHCGPCNQTMTEDLKERHSASKAHQLALLRKKYLVEQGLMPLAWATSSGSVHGDARSLRAFISLLTRAGVCCIVDDVRVDMTVQGTGADGADTASKVVEGPVLRGTYVPVWVATLHNSRMSTVEALDWVFELAGKEDAEQVAATITAMINREDFSASPQADPFSGLTFVQSHRSNKNRPPTTQPLVRGYMRKTP